MMRFIHWTSVAFAAALLGACGGGDEDPPERGTVLSGFVLGQATRAQIDASTAASGLQPLSGAAVCDVVIRYMQYATRTPNGENARASAGVLVPSGTAAGCSGPRPVVLYAHSQATDMIDGLRAAKSNLAVVGGTTASARLLITGYSQGGHVAMATHREIERGYAGEFTVTASAPMSGPYNLVGFSDVVNGPGPVNAGALIFTPMLLTSYQRSYGNIYSSASAVYQPPYDVTAPNIFPSDLSVNDLIAQGRLPADPTLTLLFGTGGLLTDAFKNAFPTSAFRAALQTNTLLGWTPQRPVAMCGGQQDPTVFYAVNTTAAQADFATRSVPVLAFDLESRGTLPAGAIGDAIYGGFQQSKVTAGANVQAQYHGTLVPPFCNALVRGFFQQVLATP